MYIINTIGTIGRHSKCFFVFLRLPIDYSSHLSPTNVKYYSSIEMTPLFSLPIENYDTFTVIKNRTLDSI